ncbi:hypothetical protein BDZ89DRAFT_1093800 [Hymenopellis radicata]|nr:hypothetical protein BDZ89DRAFT_1093800 [Hymenopellis radicata]
MPKGAKPAAFRQSAKSSTTFTPSTVLRVSDNTSRRINAQTTYCEGPSTLDNTAEPLGTAEDVHSAAMADTVVGFTYLMGDQVDAQPSNNISNDGIVVVAPTCNTNSDDPMATWRQYRSHYLDELLRWDGRGGADDKCSLCPASQMPQRAEYRCCESECLNLGLLCGICGVKHHKMLPLYWIERWNDTYYEHCTLHDLGLSVQLGHSADSTCPQRYSTSRDFTVLHNNGIHTISLFFCGCSFAPASYIQLLRVGWWPATPLEPRTALSFTLLRAFHYLNTLGKLPAWDMWQGLQAMSANQSSTAPLNRYKVLLRCIRQWRHIKMMKRGGRGHDPSGIEGTGEGELALRCPACPHPGINLPDNWRDEHTKRFLYRLFIAIDANFHGVAHFILSGPYQAHLRSHVNEDDMSTCSGFKAMFLANLKNVRGLRTTGIVGVTCSRHGLWRANGERFCNVDPPVAASLKANGTLEAVLSYDIACNYEVHFWERLAKLPEQWRRRFQPGQVVFCIPKFHLWAHKSACHGPYSFNFLPGAGRTDSEIIKRNWSVTNRAAAQTKIMGPGARQDTLEDIFSSHNFRNTQAFGRIFLRKLAEAIKKAHIHAREFTEFDAGLAHLLGKPVLNEWLTEIVAWEEDHDQPCPYEQQLEKKETLKDIELELIREECALAWEVKAHRSGATYQELNIEKQRGVITRLIQRIRGLQQIFMPHLRAYLTPHPSSVLPEETKLFLPSELKKRDRILNRACVHGLVDAETRMREAECREVLEDLRQGLHTRSAAHMFTNPTTRAEGIQRKIQIGIQLNKLRYQWACNALFQLRGHGEWERELQILADADTILDPASSDAVVAPEERRRHLSWICRTLTTPIPPLCTKATLRIEWCKARARKLRWQEEVELLLEEMRRVIQYHRWQGEWWLQRLDMRRTDVSPELHQGMFAFAMEQAARRADIANDLSGKWAAVRQVAEDFLADRAPSQIVEVDFDEEDIPEENLYDDRIE